MCKVLKNQDQFEKKISELYTEKSLTLIGLKEDILWQKKEWQSLETGGQMKVVEREHVYSESQEFSSSIP